jgi:hypothetical protein
MTPLAMSRSCLSAWQKSVSLAGRRRCYDVFVGIPLLDKPGVLEDIERRFAIAASVVC